MSTRQNILRRLTPIALLAGAIPFLAGGTAVGSGADVGDSFANWALAAEPRLEAAACTPSGTKPAAAAADPVAATVAVRTEQSGVAADAALVSGANNAVLYRDEVIVEMAPKQTVTQVIGRIGELAGGPRVAETEELVFDYEGAGPEPIRLVRFRLEGRPVGGPQRLARELRKSVPSIEASPNYALRPADYVFLWPNGDPAVAPGPKTARAANIGAGVRIAVIDTGLAPTSPTSNAAEAAALLSGVANLGPLDNEIPDVDGDGVVDYEHAGHSLAIIGVIKTLAPAVDIRVGRMTNRDGLASDWSAAVRGRNMLTSVGNPALWPDITVMSFGTPACSFRTGYLEPLGLEAITAALTRAGGEKVIVASAGNEASSEPYFPAAFNLDPQLKRTVVAVGALDARNDSVNSSPWYSASRSGSIADFANYGHGHIDGWAPGVGLETLHLTGMSWAPGGTVVEGWAYVNGSSFAGPYAAALIAQQVGLSGQTPLRAWWTLSSRGGVPEHPECVTGSVDEPLVKTQRDPAVVLRNAVAKPTSKPKPGASVVC